MRCNSCDQDWAERSVAVESESFPGINTQFCGHCGALLPVPDTVGTMLEKLTQLARFGLDAESRPILSRPEDA